MAIMVIQDKATYGSLNHDFSWKFSQTGSQESQVGLSLHLTKIKKDVKMDQLKTNLVE
jgi:hypothetical protein